MREGDTLWRFRSARSCGSAQAEKRDGGEKRANPEALQHDLRLTGAETCTLFLTKVAGRHTVLIGQPVNA